MATALIREFSGQFPLLALKISPHVHDSLGNARLTVTAQGVRIFREMEPHHKNSGQFLAAGAFESYFMETEDEHLTEAFDIFMHQCNPLHHPVVCESGALSNLIEPGILIFISDSDYNLRESKQKLMIMADLMLPAKSFDPDEIVKRIHYSVGRWNFSH